MADSLADLSTRLGQLVQQIMKETDPAKYDDLGAEIWRVLSERERLVGHPSSATEADERIGRAVWKSDCYRKQGSAWKLLLKSRPYEQRITERAA